MKVRKSNIDILSSSFIENEISMKKLLKELNTYFKLSKLEGSKEKIKRTRICTNNSNNKYTRKWRISFFSIRWSYK